jgi:hypothetical protein
MTPNIRGPETQIRRSSPAEQSCHVLSLLQALQFLPAIRSTKKYLLRSPLTDP